MKRKIGGQTGLGQHEQVTIYYDLVNVEQKPYRIFAGCPSVKMKWREAVEYADKKISSGEWKSYVIPALTGAECIFSEEEVEIGEEEKEKRYIECPCGNAEEEQENDSMLDQFLYSGADEFFTYYVCGECMNEVKHEKQ